VDDDLDPREAARTRRRDHDSAAEQRELMRPGMGKVFKQIQDTLKREADAVEAERAARQGGSSGKRRTRTTPAKG
jgi:hypothetical protein